MSFCEPLPTFHSLTVFDDVSPKATVVFKVYMPGYASVGSRLIFVLRLKVGLDQEQLGPLLLAAQPRLEIRLQSGLNKFAIE